MDHTKNKALYVPRILNLFSFPIEIRVKSESVRGRPGRYKVSVEHKFDMRGGDAIIPDNILMASIYHYLKTSKLLDYGTVNKAVITIVFSDGQYLTVTPRIGPITAETSYTSYMEQAIIHLNRLIHKSYDIQWVDVLILKIYEMEHSQVDDGEATQGTQRKKITDKGLYEDMLRSNTKYKGVNEERVIDNPYLPKDGSDNISQ